MPEAAPLRIARLTPALREDYLRFFDHERGRAFADNPQWAPCYCHFYHVAPAIDWATLDGNANRVAMDARIGTGEMDGYLAYDGDSVCGWVNAQPLPKLRHCFARMEIPAPDLPVPLHEAAAIVCFVVAPESRRRGVATALLAGALADLAQRGIAVVDAFPFNRPEGSAKATDHYHGPLDLYLRNGFAALVRHANVTVVRKQLRTAV
jgi:GNAT superfamily N-acetyltransferase